MNSYEFELEVYGTIRRWELLRRITRFVRACAPVTLGIFIFALITIAPSLHHPETASFTTIRSNNAVSEDKTLYLRPLDSLQERDIAFLARSIELRLNVPVAILPPVAVPKGARDPSQPSAPILVPHMMSALFFQKPEGAWRVLGITEHPLRETPHSVSHRDDLLYGYASARDGVGIISLHPFLKDLQSASPQRRASARDRVARVTIHELAHTEDVHHCDHSTCLMSAVTDLDALSPDTVLCTTCAQTLQNALEKPRVPFLETLHTGDGYFSRGLYRTALHHYEDALNTLERTPAAPNADRADVFNRLGAALISLDHIAEGERFVLRALELQPESLQALYNLALVRAYAGEPTQALQTLHRAMDLDPNPQARHAFAALFHLEALDDPPNALSHLHAYKRAGGKDPDVLHRFRHLENPDVIVFLPDEAEVITAPKLRPRAR